MLEVKDGRWFGGLDDDSPKVKWMRLVNPRVDWSGSFYSTEKKNQRDWKVSGLLSVTLF